ncbi:MAG: acyl-ACP--UDP-N-acetylglucosamine O-acyltransferase [Planctomycetota bacterium]|jgi:UDP-N-acetylglucosamine acyltransferase
MAIHPTAIVEGGAQIGGKVEIGPQAYVGPLVSIGDACVIGHGCHIEGRVTMGSNNLLSPYVALGTPPQDMKYHGQETELIIGADNVFREFVTVNIGTVTGRGATRIGNRNYLMICSHVAHDCVLEDDIILVNAVLLGGHCHVESGAQITGGTAVNPFVTIGKRAYVGGLSRIVQDVPPFLKVEGNPARVRGVNEIGLQRSGYEQAAIDQLWEAYKAIFRTRELNRSPIYDKIEDDPDALPETLNLVRFLRRSRQGTHGRYLESQREH